MTDAEKIKLLQDQAEAAEGVIENMRAQAIRYQAEIAALAQKLQAAQGQNDHLRAACQAVLDEFPALDNKRIESVKRICRAAIVAAGQDL